LYPWQGSKHLIRTSSSQSGSLHRWQLACRIAASGVKPEELAGFLAEVHGKLAKLVKKYNYRY